MSNIFKKLKNIGLDPMMPVLFVFIMLLISRAVVGMISEPKNQNFALIILLVLTFGISGAVWCRMRDLPRFKLDGERYVSRLKMTRPRLSHTVITAAAILALISGCLLLSINFSGETSLDGSFSLYDTFVSKYDGTASGAFLLILAYAALPAVGEELIFRGIVCAEYDKYGAVCSVTLSSFCYSLLHFNFAKIPVYLFAGIVLSLLLYATRSLYTVIIAHFAYNLFGIFGQPYITEFYINPSSIGAVITVLIMLLLLSSAVFSAGASRLYAGYAKRDEPSERKEPTGRRELIRNYRAAIVNPYFVAGIVLFLAASIILIFVK